MRMDFILFSSFQKMLNTQIPIAPSFGRNAVFHRSLLTIFLELKESKDYEAWSPHFISKEVGFKKKRPPEIIKRENSRAGSRPHIRQTITRAYFF